MRPPRGRSYVVSATICAAPWHSTQTTSGFVFHFGKVFLRPGQGGPGQGGTTPLGFRPCPSMPTKATKGWFLVGFVAFVWHMGAFPFPVFRVMHWPSLLSD
jgi:hypothetical protein